MYNPRHVFEKLRGFFQMKNSRKAFAASALILTSVLGATVAHAQIPEPSLPAPVRGGNSGYQEVPPPPVDYSSGSYYQQNPYSQRYEDPRGYGRQRIERYYDLCPGGTNPVHIDFCTPNAFYDTRLNVITRKNGGEIWDATKTRNWWLRDDATIEKFRLDKMPRGDFIRLLEAMPPDAASAAIYMRERGNNGWQQQQPVCADDRGRLVVCDNRGRDNRDWRDDRGGRDRDHNGRKNDDGRDRDNDRNPHRGEPRNEPNYDRPRP